MNTFFPISRLHILFYSLVGLFALNGCSNQPDIPRYRGYSFDATIDGVKVVELKDRKRIPALQGYVRDVRWQTVRPIDGYVDVSVTSNAHSGFVGSNAYVEDVAVVPLSSVDINTYHTVDKDESIRFGGASALKNVEVLNQKKLPAGEYVIRVKIHGSKNWDRKEIYTRVQ